MESGFEKYKANFVRDNFYEIVEVSEEEYVSSSEDEKDFYFNQYKDYKLKYYKRIPALINDEEFTRFLQLKQYEMSQAINHKLGIIKGILIFILVVIILIIFFSFPYFISAI